MYNPSQEKFLRLLCTLVDQANTYNEDEDLEYAVDGFTDWFGIHLGHRPIGRVGGYYIISSDDLARIAWLDPWQIPDIPLYNLNDPS